MMFHRNRSGCYPEWHATALQYGMAVYCYTVLPYEYLMVVISASAKFFTVHIPVTAGMFKWALRLLDGNTTSPGHMEATTYRHPEAQGQSY